MGGIAACIDVASDWLGDVKTGICSNVQDGGRFYLNRAFCCWETNTYAECADWRTWATAMGMGNKVGSYIVEYIFFIIFSVGASPGFDGCRLTNVGSVRVLRQPAGQQILPLRQTERYTRDQDSSRWLRHSTLPWSLDTNHQITRALSCSRIWDVAGQRRASSSRCLLLRECFHEAF